MTDNGFILQPDGDIVFVTVSKYRMFWKHGAAGLDALHLYLHLIFTCRLQHTNIIKANNIYLQKGLYWGKERTLKAKSLLYDFDLIKQIERKNNKGQFEGTYIVVKTTTCAFELEELSLNELSGGLETGGLETGGRLEETNALTKNKMLKQRIKNITHPSLKEIEEYVKEKNYNLDCKKFFEYYSSNDWKDKNNKPVKNWKLKLLVWKQDTPVTNKEFKDYK